MMCWTAKRVEVHIEELVHGHPDYRHGNQRGTAEWITKRVEVHRNELVHDPPTFRQEKSIRHRNPTAQACVGGRNPHARPMRRIEEARRHWQRAPICEDERNHYLCDPLRIPSARRRSNLHSLAPDPKANGHSNPMTRRHSLLRR